MSSGCSWFQWLQKKRKPTRIWLIPVSLYSALLFLTLCFWIPPIWGILASRNLSCWEQEWVWHVLDIVEAVHSQDRGVLHMQLKHAKVMRVQIRFTIQAPKLYQILDSIQGILVSLCMWKTYTLKSLWYGTSINPNCYSGKCVW